VFACYIVFNSLFLNFHYKLGNSYGKAPVVLASQPSFDNLLDAFEFISTLRMEHQAHQMNKDLITDNYMSPAEILKLERTHLKDTFKVIQTLQSYLAMKYKIS
jgi:signal-transduction protein with cAMP-binding, CBS, and nucleotidyltransferase domain